MKNEETKRPDPKELCEKADITQHALDQIDKALWKEWKEGTVRYDQKVPPVYNQDPEKGGIKKDDGKIRPELIPPETIMDMARIMTIGARKYDDWNWAKGMSWLRVYGALQRHMLAWLNCEDFDEETGEYHLSHALCCLMFLHYYQFNEKGTDDRHRR